MRYAKRKLRKMKDCELKVRVAHAVTAQGGRNQAEHVNVLTKQAKEQEADVSQLFVALKQKHMEQDEIH